MAKISNVFQINLYTYVQYIFKAEFMLFFRYFYLHILKNSVK